jgi:hypothetical protein
VLEYEHGSISYACDRGSAPAVSAAKKTVRHRFSFPESSCRLIDAPTTECSGPRYLAGLPRSSAKRFANRADHLSKAFCA